MMKILLVAVNAKYIHSNLAVYSLKAYAEVQLHTRVRTNGVKIELAEYTINHRADDILQDIFKRKPDVLAFSCYIWNLDIIEKLLVDIPNVLPQTDIWLGGPEVSFDAGEFLEKHLQVRGVMTGEGEQTFCELVQYYEYAGNCGEAATRGCGETVVESCSEATVGNADAADDRPNASSHKPAALRDIRALVYRDENGALVRTESRPCADMDSFPFPYQNLTDFENRIIYYESSRGCPFSCSYCLSSIDKSVRFRSVEKVTEELQFFLDRKVAQVKFVDRTFNCRRSHSLAIWRYIKEHDNGVTNFHFEIAADILDEEELALLETMRPGLVQLEIGVQSTNIDTIREIDRVMDFSHVAAVVRRLQKVQNIHLHLDLIAGLPYEDFASFVRSFDDVYSLQPEQLQLGFLKVLKGSKMRQKAGEYGLCYHSEPVYEVFSTNWISYEEILRLKAVEETLEIYYNSHQFAHTVRRLEVFFESPFALFAALADYHERHEFAGQKISRLGRFEILRGFIREEVCEARGLASDSFAAGAGAAASGKNAGETDAGIFDEYLLLDLYLRENSKSRPAWAQDYSQQKKAFLEFFAQEETERSILPAYAGRSARQMLNMTHLERFSEDILNTGEKGPRWILFDYQRRSPLTQDARLIDVTERIRENG